MYRENFEVYGARKIWAQLGREGIPVARCTVERLMRDLGICGALRGGTKPRTTISAKERVGTPDLVNREFTANRPNRLWVADFTYCSTWQGMAYTAFVIDVCTRKIVGWKVSTSMSTDLPYDALEMALHARGTTTEKTIHHSDRGSQYTSIRYTERLADAGLDCSVGTTGDSYDNALAESVNGLYKTELVHRQSWHTVTDLEIATFQWVDWYNNKRLHTAIGNISPTEYEAALQNQTTPATITKSETEASSR